MSQSKSFIFKDLTNRRNRLRCRVTINVTEKVSNNSNVYDIGFKYDDVYTNGVLSEVDEIRSPHPFASCDKSMLDFCDGEIVVKNAITEQMVKFMMMDNEELDKHSGTTDPQHYRTIIMFNLMKLWD